MNNNNENIDLSNMSIDQIQELYNEIIEMPDEDRIFISMCSKYCGGSCDDGVSYSVQ